MKETKKILVCPLDWGLGHATRCIPVIEELLRRDCAVWLASSGPALELLKSEFPQLPFKELTGYHPYYSKSNSLLGSITFQLPKFFKAIREEHRQTEELVIKEGIDLVLSDNRYGCWSERVGSILITHQLNIPAPRLLTYLVNRINHQSIKRFSACWVPDFLNGNSLAGKLSACNQLPVTYIGPLTRFKNSLSVQKKYDILALVSGPEPQRQLLEDILRKELATSGNRCLLVQGRPEKAAQYAEGLVEIVNHLPSAELNQAILESEIVISRPGYSTIMDLAKLQKRAIFIPTPGQPEQLYLGKLFMDKKIALCIPQDEFKWSSAAPASKNYLGFSASHSTDTDLLKKALDSALL